MDQNTRVFQGAYQDPQGQGNGFAPTGYEAPYEGFEEDYEEHPYEDEYEEEYDEEALPPQGVEEEYSVYHEELDSTHRFRVAMNVFDTASVFAGIVIIFALTALIISLVSWVRTDITHSFVILQNRIQ